MFKSCRKEDLRIVALELGETVAEKVTIVELTEIIKENKYFKEDVEFVKQLIQYTIEDLHMKEVASHISVRAGNDWFRPLELAKEIDLYNTSRGKSLKPLPNILTRNNPVKNASRVFLNAKGKEHCGFIQTADNLEHSIKKFWEIKNVETDSVKTSELDICEDYLKNTHSRDD
ncbi:hypothetical protein TNCV_803831 [Trichonephila clavipes]|nr:hypothetical protein TNCV_803831 [Trichonephila clavipes]